MQTDSRTTLRRLAALGLGAGLIVPSLAGCGADATAEDPADEQTAAASSAAEESPEDSESSEAVDAAEASYSSDETTSTGSQENPDADNWSIRMLDVFDDLRTDGEHAETGNEEVMTYNEDITVEINTSASADEHERAIVDQYGDMSVTMADGLGEELGEIYEEAMEAGELPLTQELLAKDGGMIGAQASTNPPKTYFDVDRPYLQMNMVDGELVHSTEEGGRLTLVDKEDGDAWDSTSGAFPSGHTSQAYWQGTALATMLPELAPQILARTAEAGDNRIVMGAHYALDVVGGRMMGQKIVQLRWADDEFAALMEDASEELRGVLEEECGAALETCIEQDEPYMSTDEALDYYEEKMSYDFPATGETGEDVVVPEGAESLLTTSRPDLSDEQRREVLALTAIDSGHPLDVGEEESWQRLDIASAMSAEITVGEDGDVALASDASGE